MISPYSKLLRYIDSQTPPLPRDVSFSESKIPIRLQYFSHDLQDVPSFVSTLSRCPIFRQHAVKMSHLSAVHVMICVYVCSKPSFVLFKMSHLSSARCQDVPSFGSSCHDLCECVCSKPSFVLFKMSHLSSARCQDVPSFGSSCHDLCVCV